MSDPATPPDRDNMQTLVSQLEEQNKTLEQRLAKLEAGADKPNNPPEALRERLRRERDERVAESRKEHRPRAEQREPNLINKERAAELRQAKVVVGPPQIQNRDKKPATTQFIPMEFYCWVDGAVGLVTIPIQFEPEKLED